MKSKYHKSGNLYYIKLKTNLGIFYKIGFTTYNNINERFNYNGSSDYKLIQDIFIFQYYDNAYMKEQKLHQKYNDKRAFKKYSKESYLPLMNNGQSELYYDDVLLLDKNFSYKEKLLTKFNVYLTIFKNDPLRILLILGLFIGLFPFSLIFLLIAYIVDAPEDNILKVLWSKIIKK